MENTESFKAEGNATPKCDLKRFPALHALWLNNTQYLRRIEDDPVVSIGGRKGVFIEASDPEALLALLRNAAILTNYIEDDNDNGGNER